MENAGSKALNARLRKAGEQARLARELGCSPSMVSYWSRGVRRPTTRYRAVLSDRYGIDWRAWDREVRP